MKKIDIFDSTLRDGAQSRSISFSVSDKIKIVSALDYLGIDFIEAGNPGSNPKDLEFFRRIKEVPLKNSKLAAFGSTRRRDVKVENDPNCTALLGADTPCVAIFGKSWDFHVREILKATHDENLKMIYDTVKFFTDEHREVIFDAEHFFDGYKSDPTYALASLNAAHEAGASILVLCDTNGGCFPDEISRIVAEVRCTTEAKLGIHCHDDLGCAVANSLLGVEGGCEHVQGTFLGYGERCGNANLSAIIPSLQLKRGFSCIPSSRISKLTKTARYIADVSNLTLQSSLPYVGANAFSHKGGMHIDGVKKNPRTFEHVNPCSVGNERNLLLSEVAGRTALLDRLWEIDSDIDKNAPEVARLLDRLKEMELDGYQFESADASFKILALKELGLYHPHFQSLNFKIIGEKLYNSTIHLSSAIVKVGVGSEEKISAAEGTGPVHAMDRALREALSSFYPSLANMRLSDYKVRVMDPGNATAAKVRVLIESTDGDSSWTTTGVSCDIMEASYNALVDSIEYKLYKDSDTNKESGCF